MTRCSRQVVFRFGPMSEVRYLNRLPEYGERVLHSGQQWEVVAVSASGTGKTTCVLERVLAAGRELAPDLLDRARGELDTVAWNLPRPRST